MARVEIFYDLSSPWTYLACHNIQPIIAEFNAELVWRPILVGGVFNAVNPSVHNSREAPVPAKVAYGKKDLADWARAAGLKILHYPSIFPVNAVRAMRLCCALEDRPDQLVPFNFATFAAYWADDQDISKPAVLEAILRKVGLDPAPLFAAIEQQAVKDKLRANTQELIDRGGFGSPTMFVNGTDMYFGNDRLPLLRAALERARG
jgi:2-hydroxychromene-2-carboxylate isomerase